MEENKRLDLALVKRGLAPSREKAKDMINSQIVYKNGVKCKKAKDSVTETDVLEIKGETLKYVSRGGLKLEKAINVFDIDLSEKICMDIGASTGGFTDCMLQNSAKKVYCVDVGKDQLVDALKNDSRVINLEKTNARSLNSETVKDKLDFVSCDVSFISIKLILPYIYGLLNDNAELVFLIKPQFEAGRENVGKKGVVKDKKVHIKVVKDLYSFFIANNYSVMGIDFSPIKGPEGNVEFLAYLKKSENIIQNIDIDEIVNNSHIELSKI